MTDPVELGMERLTCQVPAINRVIFSIILGGLTLYLFYLGSIERGFDALMCRFFGFILLVCDWKWIRYLFKSVQGEAFSLHAADFGVSTPFSTVLWEEVERIEFLRKKMWMGLINVTYITIHLLENNTVIRRRSPFWKSIFFGAPDPQQHVSVPAFLIDLPAGKVVSVLEHLRERHA